MRKFTLVVIALVAVLNLAACNKSQLPLNNIDNSSDDSRNNYRTHQELTASEITFDTDGMMRFSIPEIGLENVFVRDISQACKLDENAYGTVYLLADDRYGGNMGLADHYLAIVVESRRMFVKDLAKWEGQSSYVGSIYTCDFDGDGNVEIALQENIGMTGGAGQHLSRVFDFVNGEITEIFTSSGDSKDFDTGFSLTVLKNNEFEIQNKFTKYKEIFSLENRSEEYYKNHWYDENGDPKDLDLMVDSFYEFIPEDVDGDGVYEIKCRQYTSLIGHFDYIGTANTVLRYNKSNCQFEVLSASFEPENN